MDGVVDVYRGYFSRVKESHEFFLGEIFTVLLVQREKETLLLKRVSILSSLRLSGSIIRFLLFRQKTERERRSVLFLLVLREDGGGGGSSESSPPLFPPDRDTPRAYSTASTSRALFSSIGRLKARTSSLLL